MQKKVVIIGSGIAGIASAIRMACKGFSVVVYEKNSSAGGKLTDFQLGDYRFDFGPSLFTMPQYVVELFELAGKSYTDYFDFIEVPIASQYFYADGTEFTGFTDTNKFLDEACETFDVERATLVSFMNDNRKIYENAGKVFLTNSLHKMKTWLSPKVMKSLTHAYVFNLLNSMHSITSKKIKDEKLIQFFDRFATYNGSNPYEASSMLNSISILEHKFGTYFPVGGMSSITTALVQLAIELNVKFQYNTEVNRIILHKNRATGIVVNGQEILSDIVISNMDVQFTYEKLLSHKNNRLAKREKSSSAVIFYWGINSVFDQLGLHNIIFGTDYKQEFNEIFVKKRLPTDPTIYINVSSKYNKQDAPVGGENWFTMINVPADFGQDWDEEVKQLRKRVIAKINAQFDVDIERYIVEEHIADPREIREKTYAHRGALYGTSSNHWLAAFLRHPNFSRKHKGLYFVGGTVHPGGGIPLCLLSAKIVSELI